MGRMGKPYTDRHPKAWARGGAKSMAITVPLFPAPAMPMARPLYLGGYQPDPMERATPKLAPATPRATPMATRAVKLWTKK